jgi:hypothetical protein
VKRLDLPLVYFETSQANLFSPGSMEGILPLCERHFSHFAGGYFARPHSSPSLCETSQRDNFAVLGLFCLRPLEFHSKVQ